MFRRHMNHLLAAYCQNGLPERQKCQVEQHLQSCPHCREEYERLRRVHNALERLPLHTAPKTLWSRIDSGLQALAGSTKFRPAGFLWNFPWKTRRMLLTASASVILAASLFAARNYLSAPSWQVRRLTGTPLVGLFPMGQIGRLRVGQWLTTDGKSQAEIAVADIGEVTIAPQSRVRLLETGKHQHRLELARGSLDAKVTAPPRLFVVDTKAVRAVDLGCAYHLQVDSAGVTLLRVTTGEVELEGSGRQTLVIAGASCETRPGSGQGTPVMEDAPAALKTALHKFDFENGGVSAIETALTAARRQDALSLWHVLPVLPPEERQHVYNALAHLSPPPQGVTQAGILHLDAAMLLNWRDDIVFRQAASPLQLDYGPF